MWATQSCPTLCDFIVCPWNSLGKHTGVGCHSLLQGTFPTQGWNPGLLPRRQTLYQPSHRGSIDDTGLWTIPQPPCRTAVPGTHSHSRLGIDCPLIDISSPHNTPVPGRHWYILFPWAWLVQVSCVSEIISYLSSSVQTISGTSWHMINA